MRLLLVEGEDDLADSLTIDAQEFIRRFLLHVLPDRFVRIRHFGFLANRHRAEKIERARQLLAPMEQATVEVPSPDDESSAPETDLDDRWLCPECREGRLIRIETLAPIARPSEV